MKGQVEGFRIRPQARQYAKKINRMARLHKLLKAKQAKVSQEAMMLQELTGMQGDMLNKALQNAPKELVYDLEDQAPAGEQ
jgi:hypothetical protein